MTYDSLIETMEASAKEKISELLAAAGEHAAEITSTANEQAETIRRNHLGDVKKAVAIEKNKNLYTIREEVKAALIREKGAVFQDAFDEAIKILADLRNREDYPAIFGKLLDEALAELEGPDLRFHVDKVDEALCRRLVPSRNLTGVVLADIVTAGGLIVSGGNEQVVVYNTIESRLDRAKDRMKREIYSVLYGE